MPCPSTLRNLLAFSALSSFAIAAPAANPLTLPATTNLTARQDVPIYWINSCDTTIHFSMAGPGWAAPTGSQTTWTLSPGESAAVVYPPTSGASTPNNVNGGYVGKFSFDGDLGDILQFEYSQDGTYVWYDFSAQNGNPFRDSGASIVPQGGDSESDPGDCTYMSCPPGDDSACAYQGTNAWGPVKHCTLGTVLYMYLCQS